VTGWSRSASPRFDIYYDDDFFSAANRLTEAERHSALKVAKDLEAAGQAASNLEVEHSKLGRIRIRFDSGVVVLYREKGHGPRTISMLWCGRCGYDESGELLTILMSMGVWTRAFNRRVGFKSRGRSGPDDRRDGGRAASGICGPAGGWGRR
jgi:hypothetical protein